MMKARTVFKTRVFRKFVQLFPAAGTPSRKPDCLGRAVSLITLPYFPQTGTSGQWSPYLTGSVQS